MDDFDRKRQLDPQWVIDRLIEQTTRQGAEIHRLNAEIERLQTTPAEPQQDIPF